MVVGYMGFWFIMIVGVVELTSLGSVEGGRFWWLCRKILTGFALLPNSMQDEKI